mgnify:CR=1 FL=1
MYSKVNSFTVSYSRIITNEFDSIDIIMVRLIKTQACQLMTGKPGSRDGNIIRSNSLQLFFSGY